TDFVCGISAWKSIALSGPSYRSKCLLSTERSLIGCWRVLIFQVLISDFTTSAQVSFLLFFEEKYLQNYFFLLYARAWIWT
ncbi:MAG: hypothetical protein WAJ95_00410, partial [Desulfobacterales bacterium]